MNPSGLIRRKGSTCTIKRSTESTSPADNSTVLTWGIVKNGAKILFQPASAALLQKNFGRELDADYVGFTETATQVIEGDGIEVSDGYLAGTRLEVVQMLDPDQGPRHKVLAVTRAKQANAFD